MAGKNKGSTFVATYGTSSPIVAAAPTDITDGQPLDGLSAVRCVISAAPGVTLAGAGNLIAYLLDPAVLTADGAAQANGITAPGCGKCSNFQGVNAEDLSALLDPILT